MSFFGFDSTFPRDGGHPTTAPGFGQAPDPFAGLSGHHGAGDSDAAIDFDDTYDGLGDQLDEGIDDLNDDTFGGINNTASSKQVGKDFDFFGQTAKVSDAITEEQVRYSRQQAPPKSVASVAAANSLPASKPARSGYEKYKQSNQISDLQVDPTLWGVSGNPLPTSGLGDTQDVSHITEPQQPTYSMTSARKMLSLEEVEAQLRFQAKKPQVSQPPQPQQIPTTSNSLPSVPQISRSPIPHPNFRPYQQPTQQTNPLAAKLAAQQQQQAVRQAKSQRPGTRSPQILQRSQPVSQTSAQSVTSAQPRQILQNPKRHQEEQGLLTLPSGPGPQESSRITPMGSMGFGQPLPIITHPQQLMQLSEEDRVAFLIEDAKRAKRNHKIYQLSKDNGLMTPQDKNFITRIQLQQLMTATGNVNEQDPDAALSEDFYYQVHSQIRGGPRQNPHQPLSHFAQTYLFQTGGRQGVSNRRSNRGGDNHMQRMEQQVQRAVEAAKLKPKNKQLVIEGSLGKISFSNAKTPKPLLNIRRNDSDRPQSAGRAVGGRKAQTELSASDRKTVLRNIESVYTILMKLEDSMRREPPPPTDESDADSVQQHMEWRHGMQQLSENLWIELRVLDPINPGSTIAHPFIAFLSYPKGKKAIPRVFRHLTTEQHVTMLTMIVLHLDILDVVRLGHLQPSEAQLPALAREAIDLFSVAVTPSLFSYVSEAPLYHVIGLLGLILDRVNIPAVAHTRVGLSILTMLTSRATLIKEGGGIDEAEWQEWSQFYNRLFDVLEPYLGNVFPGSVNTGEDIYVWQFLAAIGSGASPEQQQRLVIAVKDRVMETVQQSKTLPPEMASQRLGNVNLFMRAIGLDVELLG